MSFFCVCLKRLEADVTSGFNGVPRMELFVKEIVITNENVLPIYT